MAAVLKGGLPPCLRPIRFSATHLSREVRPPRNAYTLFKTSRKREVPRSWRQECLRNAVIGSPIGDLRLDG